MVMVFLAFWIYNAPAAPQTGIRLMPDIQQCWAEAAKLQGYWAEHHPPSKHFQIDVSCITEWRDEL